MDYTITDAEFERLRSLVYRECGIHLSDSKKSLLVSRLAKRLRALGLTSFQDYYNLVAADPAGDELTCLLDCISTNKTEFFREPSHFAFLRERILPELAKEKRLRIWSAACSSGEEPYTIAMTIADTVDDLRQWDCRILASDISTKMLAKAAGGIYEEDQLARLPADLVRRHFLKGTGAQSGRAKVRPHLAGMITFRRINLMDDRYPIKSPLDAIFCRNVMIYFDRPTQEGVVNKLHDYLRPGGWLLIGHSESLQWVRHPFEYVAPTIYRKAG